MHDIKITLQEAMDASKKNLRIIRREVDSQAKMIDKLSDSLQSINDTISGIAANLKNTKK